MEDDPIVISSGLVITPEVVATRGFGTTFRGYNPDEVRAFLKRVADELDVAVGRQGELRHALQDALNRAAHPEVDESVLTSALGDHAARLIASAREQAAAITGEAEERAARLMRDVEEKVTRMRRESDSLMARRVEEAETVTARIRQAADSDAASLRDQARADAEREILAAQARGKEMVAEAKAVRERMLGDLARRRRAAEVQIEQLRAGRDRLAEAYETVRRTLAEVTQEMESAEPEARMAAEAVGRRSVETPIPEMASRRRADHDHDHEPYPEPEPYPEQGPAAPPSSAAASSGPAIGAPPARSLVPDFTRRPVASSERPPRTERPLDRPFGWSTGSERPSDRIAALDLSGPGVGIVPPTRRPQTVAEVTESPPGSELATGEFPAVDASPPVPGIKEPAELDDLFARIRADREKSGGAAGVEGEPHAPDAPGAETPSAETSPPESPSVGTGGTEADAPSIADAATPPDEIPAGAAAAEGWSSLDDPAPGAVPAEGAVPARTGQEQSEESGPGSHSGGNPIGVNTVADEASLQKRDEAMEPIEADLARRLKRVLQDEQNEVLDTLRRQRTPAPLTALVEVGAQRARYREAATPVLELAAAAGATFGVATGAVTGSPQRGVKQAAAEIAADLAADLVMGLRERLEAVISDNDSAGADADQFTEGISSTYRQWKLQDIEPLARHYAHGAFMRGAFSAMAEGVTLRWVVDDETPCPDCDDNALAGPTSKGDDFPTGQTHPPAHPGCRCVLVPALP